VEVLGIIGLEVLESHLIYHDSKIRLLFPRPVRLDLANFFA